MRQTIHAWKAMSLIEQNVELPNGKVTRHTSILHPGAAVIIPITDDNKILLIRQYRPTIGGWIIEVPAGTLEPNETPLACARRELEEETGYSAEYFEDLGQMTPMPSLCTEIQHLFIAKGLSLTNQRECDEDEVIELMPLTLPELEELVKNNQITDSKTIACITKAKLCGYF